MLVGDVVKRGFPTCGTDVCPKDAPKTISGTVVYIHPERRFYVVEFEFDGRTFRETYKFK